MAMKITLRDHRLDTSNWNNTLTPLGCTDVGKADQPVADAGEELHLLFLHTNRTETENRSRQWTANNPNRRLILIARDGRVGRSRADLPNHVFSCWWTPHELLTKTDKKAREFAEGLALQRFDPTLLQPTPTESLWALRLLCDGFVNSDRTQDIPDDWFQLLGPGLPANEIISKLSDNASELSEDHQAPEALTGFLMRMSQEGNPKDPSDVTECLSALNSLLGIGA
jgi:hypothetical protein